MTELSESEIEDIVSESDFYGFIECGLCGKECDADNDGDVTELRLHIKNEHTKEELEE